MRFRTLASLVLVMFCLSACSGKTLPTIAPSPSAGVLPLIVSPSPGATTTSVAVVRAQTANVQITAAVTPSSLATPASVAGTPTPVANGTRTAAAQPTAPAASHTAQPNATPPPPTARMTAIPGASPQETIGTAQDGLSLLNVRVGKNEGFTRVVFDLAKQDGSAAPVPQTRLWREEDTVVVAFGGVRDDLFGQSLGGGEQAVNTGVVQSVYRIPVRDDSAAAYGIAVSGGAKVTLSSLTSPTRVIVDIADK